MRSIPCFDSVSHGAELPSAVLAFLERRAIRRVDDLTPRVAKEGGRPARRAFDGWRFEGERRRGCRGAAVAELPRRDRARLTPQPDLSTANARLCVGEDGILRVPQEVPRESGLDEGNTQIAVICEHPSDDAAVAIDIFWNHANGFPECRIASELLRALTEILTSLRGIDAIEAYSNFPAIAHNADRVAIDHSHHAADELRWYLGSDHGDAPQDERERYGRTLARPIAGVDSKIGGF